MTDLLERAITRLQACLKVSKTLLLHSSVNYLLIYPNKFKIGFSIRLICS